MSDVDFEIGDADDNTGHFAMSMVKSTLRIIGCVALGYGSLLAAAVLFGVAEMFGVVEELV